MSHGYVVWMENYSVQYSSLKWKYYWWKGKFMAYEWSHVSNWWSFSDWEGCCYSICWRMGLDVSNKVVVATALVLSMFFFFFRHIVLFHLVLFRRLDCYLWLYILEIDRCSHLRKEIGRRSNLWKFQNAKCLSADCMLT